MGNKGNRPFSHGKSVALWHPWMDIPGVSSPLAFWQGGSIFSPSGEKLFTPSLATELLEYVSHARLFLFVNDLLNSSEFSSFSLNEVLGCSMSFMSGADHILGLSRSARSPGRIIQAGTWKWDGAIDSQAFYERLDYLFHLFNFQAMTPASLSEKVLRRTLPQNLCISRPGNSLRSAILNNHVGGRIDESLSSTLWRFVYQYDRNKAHLAESQLTPSPFHAPRSVSFPVLEQIMDFATGWWQCELVAVEKEISPIQIDGKKPGHGEVFTRWLWSEELRDCLEAGYQLIEIKGGYGWKEMSDWLCGWIQILWDAFGKESDPYICSLIKSMMVSLPGRFLRKPEYLTLILLSQAVTGDKLLCFKHMGNIDVFISDYAVHAEFDKESTALSPVGSYIVMKQRQELYHRMKAEVENGNVIVRSYIDMYATARPTTLDILGSGLGQYKEKRYGYSLTESNRFVGLNEDDGLLEMKAPGFLCDVGSQQRLEYYQRYYKKMETSFPVA